MVNGKANRLRAFVFVSASLLCGIGSVSAAPRIKVLKLSITNPTNELRLAEDVAVSVTELKKIAPDFKAGDAIVTTSDAATLEEDARTLQTIELPSQADDLDDDNKYDELAFQIDLQPKQTRIVTISYGDTATIQRLRTNYPKRTAAKFTMKFDLHCTPLVLKNTLRSCSLTTRTLASRTGLEPVSPPWKRSDSL